MRDQVVVAGWALCWGAVLSLAISCRFISAGEPSQHSGEERVDYAIVITGTEMLEGAYADAHSVFLTRCLRPLGFRCVTSTIVDDSEAEIIKAVRQALDRTSLVIVAGGLGPTEDDVTRQALSSLTGIPLREHPELLATMARRFGVPVGQLRANLRIQTEVPVEGDYLENAHGTAAGLVFETDGRLIVALPGPPRELRPMVLERLVPYLAEKLGTRAMGGLLKVRFVGIGESAISDMIDRRIDVPDDVTVGSLFEGMRVDFYFSVSGSTSEDIARLDAVKEQVLAELGDFVYATDMTSLESHVVGLFAERAQTLALAEVSSGGSLAAGISSCEGAAGVLAGAYTAPNETQLDRLLGPLDEPTASDAAAGQPLIARLSNRTGADWTVYVGPERDDAAGGRVVDVLVRQPDGVLQSHVLTARGTGDRARHNRTTQLLDLLRRCVRQ